MNRFEKEVRKALIDKDMSMKDFATQLNISVSYLCDIFKGKRPAKEQKKRIINALALPQNLLNEEYEEKGA